jgi:hypothetical protein
MKCPDGSTGPTWQFCFMGAVMAQMYGPPDYFMGGYNPMFYEPYVANYQPPAIPAQTNYLASQCTYFCYRPCPVSLRDAAIDDLTIDAKVGGGKLLVCSPTNSCPSTYSSGYTVPSSVISVKRPPCPTYICLVEDEDKACTVSNCMILKP